MKFQSKVNSIKRALADYSLRKFLFYAASPLTWWGLHDLKLRANKEISVFFKHISQWQNRAESPSGVPCFIFHPWLRTSKNKPPKMMLDAMLADSESSDPEIRMRLDRLGWALQMAIYDQNDAWQAIGKWSEERWKCGLACRGSYSISERLSNLILLWNIQEPDQLMGKEVFHMMEMDADYLLGNLEYHGERGTNNHILNNARALILAGSFLGIRRFYEAGCWLVENQLAKHVAKDGVVREASTHYQWVITRWILEVGCAFYLLDEVRFKQLRPLLVNMLDVCEAMQLGEGAETYLPFIGDISPDFPPRLYEGMTRLGYALLGSGEESEPAPSATEGLWSRFFVGRVKPVPANWHAGDNSWVRLLNNKWSLMVHSDMHPDDNRATHGHHDLFSFELAFAGIPIVVDPGRKSYLAGRDQEEAGILEEWHNTILVGGYRTGFMARGYMPIPWLNKMRTCPQVTVKGHGLEVRLNAPKEVPGIACIQRVLSLADEKRVTISNLVTKNNTSPTHVKLVMYVMGTPCLMDSGLKLKYGEREFMLCWKGLDAPVLRNAFRCVGYGISEPCTRLEWDVVATGMEWSSTIEIIALEERE